VITELAVGEALVSVLDDKGIPSIVERALIYPPRSRLTPLSADERQQLIRQSALYGHYEQVVDRESAYEKLTSRAALSTVSHSPAMSQAADILGAVAKSAARAMGTQLGRQIIRGVLGSLLGGSRRR
jgi:DNA helicase HerA-like ATPase